MNDPKKPSFPSADDPERQAAAERYLNLQTGVRDGEVWRELVVTDLARHQTPCGSYEYVAERLIKDERLRQRALNAMQEVRNRCFELDGVHGYAAVRRNELDAERFESRVRELATGFEGCFVLATRQEILPRSSWMNDEQYDLAFHRYHEVMNATDGSRVRQWRTPLSLLFQVAPNRLIAEFEMPARGVLTGHLVHRPRLGDLAEFLAIAGGLCAEGHPNAERACEFVQLASKAPPLVVHNETGPHLVFLCAD